MVRSGRGLSWEAESEQTLDLLRHWANQSLRFNRQRHHLAYNVLESEVPSTDMIMAQMIASDPPAKVQTDRQLDRPGGARAASSSSSSSSSSSDGALAYIHTYIRRT